MFSNRRWSVLLFMLLALTLVLAACAGGSDTDEKDGNEEGSSDADVTTEDKGADGVADSLDFVIATLSDAARLDPHTATDVPSYNVQTKILETLVTKNQEGEIVPLLATEWETTDDVTWVFKLQEGVKFHDGEDFNAEVVKLNLERLLDEDVAAPRAFLFENIIDVEVLDEYTIQFTTDYPFAPLLAHLTHPVGAMVSPKSIEEDYAKMEEGEEAGIVINAHPVGTGIFTFGHWDHGTEIKLVKNEDYWGKPVALNSVTFKAIPEGGTRLAELETGYAHLIEPVQPSEVVLLEDSDDAYIDERLSSSLAYVGFNAEKAPFDNKKVRQAVSMLISQDDILNGIYEGHGLAATGPLPPGVTGFSEKLKPLPYDVDKALALLEEAGFADGFSTTIWTNDNQQRMDMAILIQDSLKQANIEVDIEIVEWGAYLDKTANGEHEMFILGLSNPVGDADYFLSQLFHSANHGNSGNRTFYTNPEVDALLEEARKEIDETKRQELYDEVQEILVDDAPMMYVHHQAYLSGVSNSVKNYWIDASGYYQLHDVVIE